MLVQINIIILFASIRSGKFPTRFVAGTRPVIVVAVVDSTLAAAAGLIPFDSSVAET